VREIIFFFSGRPRTLLQYQTNLMFVSLASDPLFPKNTRAIGTGADVTSFSANNVETSFAIDVNEW
jgi:hypothetical protein